MWYGIDLFGGTGVRELNAEAVRLELAGNPIWIAGLVAGTGPVGEIWT